MENIVKKLEIYFWDLQTAVSLLGLLMRKGLSPAQGAIKKLVIIIIISAIHQNSTLAIYCQVATNSYENLHQL